MANKEFLSRIIDNIRLKTNIKRLRDYYANPSVLNYEVKNFKMNNFNSFQRAYSLHSHQPKAEPPTLTSLIKCKLIKVLRF